MYDHKTADELANRRESKNALADVGRANILYKPGVFEKIGLISLTLFLLGEFYRIGIEGISNASGDSIENIEDGLNARKAVVNAVFESNPINYAEMLLLLIGMTAQLIKHLFAEADSLPEH